MSQKLKNDNHKKISARNKDTEKNRKVVLNQEQEQLPNIST